MGFAGFAAGQVFHGEQRAQGVERIDRQSHTPAGHGLEPRPPDEAVRAPFLERIEAAQQPFFEDIAQPPVEWLTLGREFVGDQLEQGVRARLQVEATAADGLHVSSRLGLLQCDAAGKRKACAQVIPARHTVQRDSIQGHDGVATFRNRLGANPR